MNWKIAVIGSGPAACIAAWCAHVHGHHVDLYTADTGPSALPGAQYLHSIFPLPGGRRASSEPITYHKMGTREGYSRKIYGADFDPALTSWDKFPSGMIYGWPLREIYAMLHEWALPRMTKMEVNPSAMRDICLAYDFVFCSAPGFLFSEDPTAHEEETVYVVTKTTPFVEKGMNLIVYNGEPSVTHYRYSHLEGVTSYEYPGNIETIPDDAIKVTKPLRMNSPLLSEKIIPIGRYGRWEKGVLVDSVWRQVQGVLEGEGLMWLS